MATSYERYPKLTVDETFELVYQLLGSMKEDMKENHLRSNNSVQQIIAVEPNQEIIFSNAEALISICDVSSIAPTIASDFSIVSVTNNLEFSNIESTQGDSIGMPTTTITSTIACRLTIPCMSVIHGVCFNPCLLVTTIFVLEDLRFRNSVLICAVTVYLTNTHGYIRRVFDPGGQEQRSLLHNTMPCQFISYQLDNYNKDHLY